MKVVVRSDFATSTRARDFSASRRAPALLILTQQGELELLSSLVTRILESSRQFLD